MLFARIGQGIHAMAATFGRLRATEEPSLLEEIWAYLVDRYFSINLYEYQFNHLNLTQYDGIFLRNTVIAVMFGIVIASAAAMYQKRTLGDLVRALQREDCISPDKAMTLEQLGLLRNTAIKQDLRHGTSLKRFVRCVGEEAYHASLNAAEQGIPAPEEPETEAPVDPEKKETTEPATAKAPATETPETVEEAPVAEAAALSQSISAIEGGKRRKAGKRAEYRYDFATDRFYIPESIIYSAEIHFDKKGTNPLIFAFVLVAAIIFAALVCFFLPELLKMIDNFIGQL